MTERRWLPYFLVLLLGSSAVADALLASPPICWPQDTWIPTALPQATIPGFEGGTAVWTGSRLLVFKVSGQPSTGGIYDPAADTWTALPVPPLEVPPYGGWTEGVKAIWTGHEVILWGGYRPGSLEQPANHVKYNPATGVVTTIPSSNPHYGLFDHSLVWTGTELIVWGGNRYDYNPDGTMYQATVTTLAEGVRYDPRTGVRTPFAPAGQMPRAGHSAVWTGGRMIVYGGYQAVRSTVIANDFLELSIAGGAAFDPSTGAFQSLATTGQPSARDRHTAVWTGAAMLVWGGGFTERNPQMPDFPLTTLLGDGAACDPVAGAWTPIPTGPGSPSPRTGHAVVWTGSDMIVWNGPPDRARYDPAGATWTPVAMTDAPCPATATTVAWTGRSLLAWGCADGSGGQYSLYQQDDRDGDGFSVCQGDCDDAGVLVHPGAAEICDLVDDDCDGGLGAGEVDDDEDGVAVCAGDCRDDRADIHPGAAETCNRIDDDCDGLLPPGEADADADGYMACDLDCDDADAAIRPGTTEECDGVDNDCDGGADDGFPDTDGDNRADCVDCLPGDPATWAAPPEVTNLQPITDGGQFLVWDDLAPAAGWFVTYDSFHGSLAALRQGGGDFSSGACLLAADPGNGLDIGPVAPVPGDGFYFIVRGRNGCGVGTYGSAPRDQTAAAGALACP